MSVLGLLRGSGGERSLSGALGRWAQMVSQAVDTFVSPGGIFSYGAGRAQMGFAEVSTPGNTPTTVKAFSVAGLEDSNYMAVAQFSAKGGGVAMLTRRRAFQVVGGVLSALDAIEEIGTDEGADAASVAVDIAASGTDIQFNVTGIAATDLNWVVEWGVSRY